jgi:hypothetical protein
MISEDEIIDDEFAEDEFLAEDDFDDEISLDDEDYEEEDFVEEDWDSYDDYEEEEQAQAVKPKKKKRSKSDKMIVVGLLVLAVFVFLVKNGLLGSGEPTADQLNPQQQIASANVAPAAVPAPVVQQPAQQVDILKAKAPVTMATNRRELIRGDNVIKTEPLNKVEDGRKGFLNSEEEKNKLQEDLDLAVTDVNLIYDEDDEYLYEIIEDGEDDFEDNAKRTYKEGDAPTNIAGSSSSDVEFLIDNDAFEDRLLQITDRLDDMDVSITSLQEDTRIDDLQESLDSLEGKMDMLSDMVERVAMSGGGSDSGDYSSSSSSSASYSGASATATVSKNISSGSSARWVLKGAVPGKAWVSREGSKEVYHVNIGDTLSGIGKITAINKSGNDWHVTGTSGSIVQ